MELVEGTQWAPSIPLFVLFVDWQLGFLHWAVKRTFADKSLDCCVSRYNLHSHSVPSLSWLMRLTVSTLSIQEQSWIDSMMSHVVITLWSVSFFIIAWTRIIWFIPHLASNKKTGRNRILVLLLYFTLTGCWSVRGYSEKKRRKVVTWRHLRKPNTVWA